VSYHCPVLLPTPSLVFGPIIEKLLLDEGTFIVVGKMFDDGVESIFQEIGVFFLPSGQPEID